MRIQWKLLGAALLMLALAGCAESEQTTCSTTALGGLQCRTERSTAWDWFEEHPVESLLIGLGAFGALSWLINEARGTNGPQSTSKASQGAAKPPQQLSSGRRTVLAADLRVGDRLQMDNGRIAQVIGVAVDLDDARRRVVMVDGGGRCYLESDSYVYVHG